LQALAVVYRYAGRSTESIQLLQQLCAQQTHKLGRDHPDTMNTLHSLARAYQAAERNAEAIQLFEQVRDQQTEKLGSDHPSTLATLHCLAWSYQFTGRSAEAIRLFEQVHKQQVKRLGPHHPETLNTLASLVPVLITAKQLDRATAICRDLLDVQSRGVVQGRSNREEILGMLGVCLLHAGKPAEAEPVFRESLAIWQEKQSDDWKRFLTQSLLGDALAGQQKYAEAEPLLLAGYEGIAGRFKTLPPAGRMRLTEARERLVQFYDAWGKKDQAAGWRQKGERAASP
jgi:tetratricopeptide (TPR) repeat protein